MVVTGLLVSRLNFIKIEVALVEPPLFKAPQNAVIFTGSAHPNEGETGQLKRCTYTREVYQADFT